jgi:parvulin-like peptidyl-prolyl isomerase
MRIQAWGLRTLASAAMVMALVGLALSQAPVSGRKQVAIVNGEPITLADVEAILKSRPIESIKLSEADYHEMQKEALNLLIDELIMHQFLVKNAPSVPTSQVNKMLGDLQDALKKEGQSLADYYHLNDQTEAQVRNSIVSTLQWKAYLDNQLDEERLRKYYEANRDLFDQVTVRASHILIRLRPEMTAADREGIRNWLLGLRQDIVAGKQDFADAARKYSQDVSAPRGGDLGFFPRKGAVEEGFAGAAFALKPNEISNVVQTESGMHLIKVTERKAGPSSDFKMMEGNIRAAAGEEIMAGILAQQRKVAQVKITLGDDPAPKTTQSGTHFLFGSH